MFPNFGGMPQYGSMMSPQFGAGMFGRQPEDDEEEKKRRGGMSPLMMLSPLAGMMHGGGGLGMMMSPLGSALGLFK